MYGQSRQPIQAPVGSDES